MGQKTWKKTPGFIDDDAGEYVTSEAGALKPCVFIS